jgi:hypothetical protein
MRCIPRPASSTGRIWRCVTGRSLCAVDFQIFPLDEIIRRIARGSCISWWPVGPGGPCWLDFSFPKARTPFNRLSQLQWRNSLDNDKSRYLRIPPTQRQVVMIVDPQFKGRRGTHRGNRLRQSTAPRTIRSRARMKTSEGKFPYRTCPWEIAHRKSG